jgi:hypothetical protein
MRGETFEETRARCQRQDETGRALAEERHDRGQRLTDDERSALAHWSRWGSDGYPLVKRGRGWVIEHPAFSGPLYKTKREAWCAWETFVAILVSLSGLEAAARRTA